jgi:hypothetical protein
MATDPRTPASAARAKLAETLRKASEELLADGDAEGARIAADALKELKELGAPSGPDLEGEEV